MTQVTITDLTRMQYGNVCIAGYTPERRCIRPLFAKGGISEAWLFQPGGVAIRPFAVIDFRIEQHIPDPPHSEDHTIDPVYRVVRHLSPGERHTLLADICDPAVAAIFGAELHEESRWYIMAHQGHRSLGTVRATIEDVIYQPHPDRWEYSLIFADATGARYCLGVVDLALRASFDCLRERFGVEPDEVARRFLAAIHDRQAEVFLRIGLSRGWAKHPDRCYLQITGIHTCPDYLRGKCFADFS
jgi:hypothetical protein